MPARAMQISPPRWKPEPTERFVVPTNDGRRREIRRGIRFYGSFSRRTTRSSRNDERIFLLQYDETNVANTYAR